MMERLASSTNDDAGPGGTVHNQDINPQSMLVDGENDGFKSEKSFLDDIACKQAEIIHGFPLVSLTGVSDVAKHLPSLQFTPVSAFPYPPPKASGSTRGSDYASQKHSDDTRTHFHDDPLFKDYEREVRLLMGTTKLKDATVNPTEWTEFKAHARGALYQAIQAGAKGSSKIVWKDPPFGNPAGVKLEGPYEPSSFLPLRDADPSGPKSLAVKLIDDLQLSYPSPASHSRPSLYNPPATIYKPSKEVDWDNLTRAQRSSVETSKAFLRDLIKPVKGEHEQGMVKSKSPIPLIPAPTTSSAAVTPRKPSGPFLHPESASSQLPIASTSAAKPFTSAPPCSHMQVLPSPISQASSSPDPLAIPRSRSANSANAHHSSPIVVVEVGLRAQKRPSTANLHGKSAKRHASDQNSEPVGTYASSEMDVDASDGAEDYLPSSDSKAIQAALPSRKQSGPREVQSPSKSTAPVSTLQMEETQMREFSELVDELLDAEASGSRYYFLQTTDFRDRLLLTPSCMRKISKAVRGLVKRASGKRIFEQAVDVDQMTRLLAILQRSIETADALAIVPAAANSGEGKEKKSPSKTPKKSKKKSKKGDSVSPLPGSSRRRSSRSATPASYREDGDSEKSDNEDEGEEDDQPKTPTSQSRPKLNKRTSTTSASKGRKGKASKADMDIDSDFEWDEKTLAALDDNLVTFKNAITATDTVMILLGSANLPKQLYSEDLINLGLGVLKTQLASVIYPSLDPERSPLGSGPVDEGIATLIRKILSDASSAFTSITALLKQEEATDATLINAVYIAIAPFFSEPSLKNNAKDVSGSLEMKVVRSQALAIIRTIFARYPAQRQWIIEEVLSSITKLPDLAKRKPQYMLRNGQAIQAISALLLHIVQSCTSGLRTRMLAALQDHSTPSAADVDEDLDIKPSADFSVNTVNVAQHLVEPVLEAARQSAGVIVGYVVRRSGKAAKNSTAGEAEYKALLEHLVRDLLIVADLPEWPAATLMLQMAIKAMIAVLDDGKVTADANTAKGISLEHFGTISSKVYKMAQASKQVSAQADQEHASRILPITQVLREQDRKALRRLATAEHAYIQQLLDDPTETEDIESAVDFASARWSAELLRALRILQNLEEGYKAKFEKELCARQETLWEMAPSGATLQFSNDEYQALLQQSLRTLFPVHELCQSMNMLLAHVLRACEGAVIAFRQKALKALASIVEQDPSIFLQEDVREAVEKRLMDSSAAVRDAALEMLGRYVVYRPELAQEYLSKIEERINDSGLSVRKRVIKLLKSLYPVLGGLPQRASICRRLVSRVYDEDDSVKELAASAFEDIYLPSAQGRSQRGAEEVQSTLAKKRDAASKGRVLMTVAAEYRDRPNPLEDVLRMIFEKYGLKKSDKNKEHLDRLTAQLKDIVEVLIDNLVDPEQTTDFKLVHCIKTVYILLAPEPAMLEIGKAAMLLPYLKSATNVEEQTVVEYLSKIFGLILPTLPRSASTFAQRLQDSLRGLLNKPAAIGSQALPDVVSCFCSVVVHQTNDYGKLCNVFDTCYKKLQQGVQRLTHEEKPTADVEQTQLLRGMPILARLVALFCQFGRFDRLRESSPDAAVFIDAISRNSIEEQVYEQMVQLYHLSTGTPLHGTSLQCLGFLYRAHPRFMLEENSTAIMDKIFLSASAEAKALLLRNICDFLVSQSYSGHGEETNDLARDVDMTLLIGDADNFADSGVSTAIVQRYLHHILEAALTPASSQYLLRPALEAIGFTVRQGLAHPMQCLPVLVALETCTDASVASKAFSLHSLLHEKQSGLINTRLTESIDTVIKYQKRVLGERSITGHTGDPPSALLCRWYALMREKRQWRNEFLKAFLRGLHVEPTASEYTQEHVNVARFTAENLATFEYKSLEEVFFVVRTLTVLLSVAGMQIYHQMQKEERLDMEVDDETASSAISESVVRKSVALTFAFCLRQQLKTVYGITDQKLAKYSLGKKSPAGDKPAVPRGEEKAILSCENMPFTTNEVITGEDRAKQCEAYITLIDSDGTIKEVEGEQDSDEDAD